MDEIQKNVDNKKVKKAKQTKKAPLNMYGTLVMFALIPLVVASVILVLVLTNTSSKEIEEASQTNLLSLNASIEIQLVHPMMLWLTALNL